MLATTSSAFISPPVWNFTPLRSLKVHTVPLSFGVQLSASTGCSTRSGPSTQRNSADLLHHQQAAGIGDGDRIDRRRRHAAGDADGGAGRALGARERRHAAEAGGRADAAEQRQRQAEQAAVADEFAAADAAVDEAVDQVIFERRAIAPDEVENAIVLAHGFLPFPLCFYD